jgi:hypothetical protein
MNTDSGKSLASESSDSTLQVSQGGANKYYLSGIQLD